MRLESQDLAYMLPATATDLVCALLQVVAALALGAAGLAAASWLLSRYWSSTRQVNDARGAEETDEADKHPHGRKDLRRKRTEAQSRFALSRELENIAYTMRTSCALSARVYIPEVLASRRSLCMCWS